MQKFLAILLLALGLGFGVMGAGPVSAQDTTAAADAAPAAEDAPAENAAPAYPEGLSNQGIALDELKLRVIPLRVDQLEALAQDWLAIVQRQTQAVTDLQVRMLNTEGAAQDDLRGRLTEVTQQRGEAFQRFTLVVDSFEKKGGDAAVVAQLRAYRSAIIVDEKQNADWETLLAQAVNWALQRDGGIKLAIQVATIAASFLGLLIVARMARGFARRGFSRVRNLSKLLQAFLAMIVYWITMAFGLMVVLSMLGIDITPVFALVGGLSFIAAFAFQDTLGNLAAGLMIMFNRPFDEGDYVTVAGTGGTVKSVSVVSTTVTTPDNQVIVIPNSKVWGDIITNVTASATRRVDLVFGISYEDSIADAQRILEQVVAAHPMVLADPEPVIRVNALGASSVDFICRPWARSGDYWAVYWDLTRQVKEAFDAAGISIPYPQTDMHIHVRDAAAAGALDVPLVGAATPGMGRPAGAPDFRSGDDGADGAGDAGEERG
jgi:small conductance mechanosensitive channel